MHGRARERAHLTSLLDAARSGSAAAVVIRGEAGLGKSALLDSVVADADRAGMRVLRTQGLESESPLAFAGLHQLLRPVLHLLDELPPPQARALRVVFGQQDGAPVEPFVVALATLAMLTEAADARPLLCVVDDAHWLDDASAEALLFAARRLHADPVAMILTVRDGDSRNLTADGVPSMHLSALDEASGRALLAEHVSGPLAEAVVRALLQQADGNPLALLELPSELSAEQLAGTAPLPPQLQLTERVQQVFLDRCRRQPPQVQALMLVAAADDTSRVAVVERAAALLGVPTGAIQEAERAQLLSTDRDVLRVRHPLVRSAVYQAATGQERRSAHRALAAALEGSDDPDRQTWHLAAAADGADPAVAAALEAVAERAARAGGYRAAAAAYSRAAELTAARPLRASRLFAAGRHAWASGHAEWARALAETAKPLADDPLLRADIDRLRARIEVNIGSAATAHHIFTSAARAVAAEDPVRALEMRVAATLTHVYNAGVGEDGSRAVATPQEQPTGSARTQCLHHLLRATTADAEQQWARAVPALRAALALVPRVEDVDVLANLGNAALHLGDDDGHRQCYTRMLAESREQGAVMSVLYALPRLAFADMVGGDWRRVREAADEALTLSADIGQRSLAAAPLGWRVLIAALQGDDGYADLRSRLDAASGQHLGVLTGMVRDMSRWAAGVHALHSGDPAAAAHELSRLRLAPLTRMAAPDRFEAAVRAGDVALATHWVEELASFADATGWAWALASVAYGRALLADAVAAPAFFEAALAHHAQASRPYELARTQLAYGELLRRVQRRVDARAHLRSALAVFDELGAQPLATRARQELRASGETARKREPSSLTTLTPMEMQVVQLVAQGLTNKEVGGQLWISPRTVAFHLRGAFAKLGISSRGELTALRR